MAKASNPVLQWPGWVGVAGMVGGCCGTIGSYLLVVLTAWLSNLIVGNTHWGKGSPATLVMAWPVFMLICVVAGVRWSATAMRWWQSPSESAPPEPPLH